MEMDAPETPAAVELLERASHQFLSRVAPVRFGLAGLPAEKEAVYRLRYLVVTEQGWARPEELPNGLEMDAYDEKALHIVAWDGDALAATARLVFPEPGRRLPSEEAFDTTIEPRGRFADMGRIVVAKRYRDTHHRMLLALMGYAWLQAQQHGLIDICGTFTPAMIKLSRLMGIVIIPIGPPRLYWGEERFLIRTDLLASAAALNRL
jgi:N-acyl-L-homoserine lactone synthetase